MPSAAKVMPISKKSDIDIGWGTTLRIEYSPAAITMTRDDSLGEDDKAALARQICAVVTDWDLTGPVPIGDEPGVKAGSVVAEDDEVPLNPEKVQYLPLPLLQGIINGLIIDAVPDPNAMRKRLRQHGSTPTPIR